EVGGVGAERGGKEVQVAVLAATLTTSIVFFPVIFLNGVSRFLFTALALAVVLSLFASYFVAMTVVPLFCARLIKPVHAHDPEAGADAPAPPPPAGRLGAAARRFNVAFSLRFTALLDRYAGS